MGSGPLLGLWTQDWGDGRAGGGEQVEREGKVGKRNLGRRKHWENGRTVRGVQREAEGREVGKRTKKERGRAWRLGGGEPSGPACMLRLHLCSPHPQCPPRQALRRPRFRGTRLRGAGWNLRPGVWGSALRLPLSCSPGGLHFILFAGRLGLLSGFNDLCHYL